MLRPIDHALGDHSPGQTLLSRDGVAWRINREAVLMMGARRALLMQIAHPLVGAGVAQHSDFARDPFGRLRRTLETMFMLSFGTIDEARQAYERIDAIHERVHGNLARPVGGFAAGSYYDARHPELLFWVHATLVDTATLIYRRYVRDLSDDEEEQYYQESKAIPRLFQIPESVMPARLSDFHDYMRRMIDSGTLQVGRETRPLARSILYPAVPMVPSFVFDLLNLVTIGLLPAAVREEFGLKWNRANQFILDSSSRAIRAMMPLLPDLLRANPAARAAERLPRESAADAAD